MTASAPSRIGLYCHGDRITQREALSLAAHPSADAWAMVPHLVPGLLTVKRRDQITREEEEENLVLACWACNNHKRARTPEEAGMQLRPLEGMN